MTEAIAGFQALMDEKASLEEKIRDKGKDLFYEETKSIFEKHGDILDTFGWCQYTPYFNDGDPCEFTVHDLFMWSKNDRTKEDFEENNYFESNGDFSSWGTEDNKLARYLYSYCYEYQPYSYGKEPKKPVEIKDEISTREPSSNRKNIVGEVHKYENPDFDPTYGEAYEEVINLYNTIDENTLKSLFGDHVVVLVTADGVSVEEYSHD